VERVLVVCPVSTIFNWINEFKLWLPTSSVVKVYEMVNSKDNPSRMGVLRSWMESGGVMVIGYEMYRILTDKTNPKINVEDRVVITFSLVDPGPELVVCDEGHTLKNEKSASKISTRRRITLTGTPIQNNLLEYHAMVQFVKPLLLGTAAHFTDFFAKPINNGQSARASGFP
jgi:transcriptional regulator ATRX